jgi:predicted phage terminase large subunit-like protein
MMSPAYRELFPNTVIQNPSNKRLRLTSNLVETSAGGYLFSVGVGGSTTGKTATAMICDDLTKDWRQAQQKGQRDFIYEWFNSVAQTRCTKDAPIIVMNTRWHMDDISGRLLKKAEDDPEASQYEVLSIPAAYDPNLPHIHPDDPRTEKGEALWPEVKGDDVFLERLKRDVGDRVWSALYQQYPKTDGGNIIKESWIKYYSQLPFSPGSITAANSLQSWDLTFKETGSSYVVGIVMVRYQDAFYIVDMFREKTDIVGTMEAFKEMSGKYRFAQQLIEDKANGPAIISLLRKQFPNIVPVKPTSTKDERLHVVSPLFEQGRVFLPTNAPWTRLMVEELTSFPASSNDDIVDAISQGLQHFNKLSGSRRLEAMSRL